LLPALVTGALLAVLLPDVLVTGAFLAVVLLGVLVTVAGRKAGIKKLLSDARETLAVAATEVSVVAGFKRGRRAPGGRVSAREEGTAAR
jgi:uncharacterized membrane protein YfcA